MEKKSKPYRVSAIKVRVLMERSRILRTEIETWIDDDGSGDIETLNSAETLPAIPVIVSPEDTAT